MAAVQTRLSYPVKKRSLIIRSAKSQSTDSVCISSDSSEDNYPRNTPKKNLKPSIEATNVTPPKQRRLGTDNAENISPKTPSTLLAKLDLESSDDEKQSRRKLFGSDNKYDNARRALHSAVPSRMPARAEELEFLRGFINGHLEGGTSGTLYMSGPPGTGKTAALIKTLTDLKVNAKYEDVYINCTSIKSASAIYSKLVIELGLKCRGKSEKCFLSAIEKYLVTKHKTLILVLDEIDQLDSRKQSVLYTVFEWPSRPNSHLILIGIANALDLTDRILPRLQARCELKPERIHFAPYTKQQIIDIIVDRLNIAGVSDVFSPIAIQMLAGKVSAISGDIRRALDIARRVVEIVGTEQRRPLQPVPSELNTKSLGVNQVVSVLNTVYGTSNNLQEDVDESLPLQQKVVVCCLILMLKKAKNKDVTVGRLHEVYRKVCAKRNFSAVDQSEFIGLCSLLETRGMIKLQGRKEARLNRVCLEWDEDEVASVLKDKQLLSSVIEDVSVLSK